MQQGGICREVICLNYAYQIFSTRLSLAVSEILRKSYNKILLSLNKYYIIKMHLKISGPF